MSQNKLGNTSFLVLFAGVALLLFFVFMPFLPMLALAAVFAVLLYRPYERIVKIFRGWKSVAAGSTVFLILAFFIIPLFLLGMQIFQEIQNVYLSLYGNGAQYLHIIQQAIESPIRSVFLGFTFDINPYIGNILAFLSNNLGTLVYQTFSVALGTFFMLLALFFFLRDGHDMVAALTRISPLGGDATREMLSALRQSINSVIQGTFVNALIRWAFISIAFSLFGIPNAVLWGALGGVVGAIPGLGTIVAFIPAVAFLGIEGHYLAATGLALSGLALFVLVDNVLTAYFFGRGFTVSPIFVLFSILGGILFFGPLGFILGPLVLSVFLSIAHVSLPS